MGSLCININGRTCVSGDDRTGSLVPLTCITATLENGDYNFRWCFSYQFISFLYSRATNQILPNGCEIISDRDTDGSYPDMGGNAISHQDIKKMAEAIRSCLWLPEKFYLLKPDEGLFKRVVVHGKRLDFFIVPESDPLCFRPMR